MTKGKKFELTDMTKDHIEPTVHRIRALRDIPGNRVQEGDIGGFVESEDNLRQRGSAWVGEDAIVKDCALVAGSAVVRGSAVIRGSALVKRSARVAGDAVVEYGAVVAGDAVVTDNARVKNRALVTDNARVKDGALVKDGARVAGSAYIKGNSSVGEEHEVVCGYIEDMNLRKTEESLFAQLGVAPVNGEVTLYKKVWKIEDGVYYSDYDEDFKYRDGEIAVVEDADMSNASCSSGIHCGNMLRWNSGDTWIAVRVRVEDIITVQNGKARCERVKVIGEVDKQEDGGSGGGTE